MAELRNPAPAAPVPGKCNGCAEAKNFNAAVERWRTEERADPSIKRIAILAPLSDFRPSYSHATVVLDQMRSAALIPHARVVLFVLANCDLSLLPSLPSNVEVFRILPTINAGNDRASDPLVNGATKWIEYLLTNLKLATIITHDLVFQAAFLCWAKAFHHIGDHTKGFTFLHMMHSSVGSRPADPNVQWRCTVPDGHFMIALNAADVPYICRYYATTPDRIKVLPNPRDVRSAWHMTPHAAELVTKHQLHLADYFQIYPLSAPRMQAKGVTKVIDVLAEVLKQHNDEPSRVRLLIADAHANGTSGLNEKALVRRYAQSVGLPDECLVFVSESLGQSDPQVLAYGLDGPSVSNLFQLSSLFIFPTTSEAGSLVLMEAALSGAHLVLNASLPCLREYVSPSSAQWESFGSTKETGSFKADQVAARIEEAMSDLRLRAKRRAIQGQCWERYAELLQELPGLRPAE